MHYELPVILYFDLADERFQVVPEPSGCGSNSCGYQLAILGDCLSATAFCNRGKFVTWLWSMEWSFGSKSAA